MFDADLVQTEVDTPPNEWCDCGHQSNGLFQDKPIRFFKVVGHGINQIYCEPCLVIAHHMSRENKKERGK